MGRHPKQPKILNSVQSVMYRHLFLYAVQRVCPEVFDDLKTSVADTIKVFYREKEGSPGWEPGDEQCYDRELINQLLGPALRLWAEKYRVTGVWIENQAVDLAHGWAIHPESRGHPGISLSVQTDPLMDRIREFHLTIPIPHEYRFERPYFNSQYLREYLNSELKEEFNAQFARLVQSGIDSGTITETILPAELRTKMEVTALYLFRGLSTEEIAAIPGYARDRTILNRWIVEVSKLLDLEVVRLHRSRKRS